MNVYKINQLTKAFNHYEGTLYEHTQRCLYADGDFQPLKSGNSGREQQLVLQQAFY